MTCPKGGYVLVKEEDPKKSVRKEEDRKKSVRKKEERHPSVRYAFKCDALINLLLSVQF